MHYLRQVVSGGVDEWVHDRFIRYGKGAFDGPVISAEKKGKAVKVSASWEYATSLLGLFSSLEGGIQVKGMVFAKRNLSGELKDFLKISKEKKGKLYSAEVSGEIEAEALKGLLLMIPDASILLDATHGKSRLKCKKKLPKPGSGQDDSFASAQLEERLFPLLREEFFFDVEGEFGKIRVSHKYRIDELVPPDGVSDSARIRLEAKRKGTLTRTVEVDGISSTKAYPLLV